MPKRAPISLAKRYPEPPTDDQAEVAQPSPSAPVAASTAPPAPRVEPADEATVGVMIRVPKSLHKALKSLAVDREMTIQSLVIAEIHRLTKSKQ